MPSISNVTVCILVLRHPDDGHKCDQNMLVNNSNMWLNMDIINAFIGSLYITQIPSI